MGSALVSIVTTAQGELQWLLRPDLAVFGEIETHGTCVIGPAMGEHFVTIQVRIRGNDYGFEATDWAHPESLEISERTSF